MDHHIHRLQSFGRASMTLGLAAAAWVGATAMGFGFVSCVEALTGRPIHPSWVAHLFG